MIIWRWRELYNVVRMGFPYHEREAKWHATRLMRASLR